MTKTSTTPRCHTLNTPDGLNTIPDANHPTDTANTIGQETAAQQGTEPAANAFTKAAGKNTA